MSEDRRKVMIMDGESEAARAFDGMLSPHWDVTAVASAGEAADKAAREDFDVIVTGYVLPRLSGQEGVLALRSVENMVAEEKAALLKKVRDTVERVTADLQAMRPGSEAILRQSQAREEKAVEIFEHQLRRVEEERDQLDLKIQDLEEKVGAALKEKEEAVRSAEAASRAMQEAQATAERARAEKAETEREVASITRARTEAEEGLSKLRGEIATLGGELQEAVGLAEKAIREKGETEEKLRAAIREKSELQEKLTRFQENWEKYVSASQ